MRAAGLAPGVVRPFTLVKRCLGSGYSLVGFRRVSPAASSWALAMAILPMPRSATAPMPGTAAALGVKGQVLRRSGIEHDFHGPARILP